MKNLIFLLFGFLIFLTSCLPSTNGKEPDVDRAISSLNSDLSTAADTLPVQVKKTYDSVARVAEMLQDSLAGRNQDEGYKALSRP